MIPMPPSTGRTAAPRPGGSSAGLRWRDCLPPAAALAVLFGSGQASSVVLMNSSLDIQYEGTVPTAHGIARGSDAFYLLCDSSVECFGLDGTYQWTVAMDARPQAMLANSSGLFVFTDNMVQRITPPDQDASSEAADSAASSVPAA